MDGLIYDWSCEAVDYVAGRRSADVVEEISVEERK